MGISANRQKPGSLMRGGQLRPYLPSTSAFAMLRDIGRRRGCRPGGVLARLVDAESDRIEDQRDGLIVVTSRICLNQINSPVVSP
jgi:hypothetical protein